MLYLLFPSIGFLSPRDCRGSSAPKTIPAKEEDASRDLKKADTSTCFFADFFSSELSKNLKEDAYIKQQQQLLQQQQDQQLQQQRQNSLQRDGISAFRKVS
ncbi:hypothetical protein Emed_004138 [Eimeria media]